MGIIFKDGPITMIHPARVEAEIISIEDNASEPNTENKDNMSVLVIDWGDSNNRKLNGLYIYGSLYPYHK